MRDIMLNDYGALVTEIEACRGHEFRPVTQEAIIAELKLMGWYRAKSAVERLCRLKTIPQNVVGAIRDMREEQSQSQSKMADAIPTDPERKPPEPCWIHKWHEVSNEILRYHVNDMAKWENTALHIAPIPEDGICPNGWWPVAEHFCITKFERKMYSDEGYHVGYEYDPVVHDSVYALVMGDTERELKYMTHYQRVLAQYRAKRGVVPEPVTRGGEMQTVGAILSEVA